MMTVHDHDRTEAKVRSVTTSSPDIGGALGDGPAGTSGPGIRPEGGSGLYRTVLACQLVDAPDVLVSPEAGGPALPESDLTARTSQPQGGE
jgi:hypothetical protein